MTYLEKEKHKSAIYRQMETTEYDLKRVLLTTRDVAGFSIKDIANVIKKCFDKAEIESLIKELK